MSGAFGRPAEILRAPGGMSSEPEHAVQATGFRIFSFISVVLVVLKLTVAGSWSWWRVILPLLAFLGHNALYILVGLICFRWLKDDGEEQRTSIPGMATISRRCYFSSYSWTTYCDVLRDKPGTDSGHAREDSK